MVGCGISTKPLLIEEIDGSPSGRFRILKVSNGRLTDNGDGSATLDVSGGTATFADSTFAIFNNADNSKIMDFDVSGVTTSTTRTITMADRDLTLDNITTSTTTNLLNTRILYSDGSNIQSNARLTFDGTTLSTGSGNVSTTNLDIDAVGKIRPGDALLSIQTSAASLPTIVTVKGSSGTGNGGALLLGTGNNIHSQVTHGIGGAFASITFGSSIGTYRINDDGFDVDTIIEGDTDTNLFKVDAGSDNIGIGVAGVPSEKLEVNGSVLASNILTTGTLGSSGADITDGVTATTQTALDNSTKIATTAYVDSAVSVENLWNRSGTELSTANAGDDVTITGLLTTASIDVDGDSTKKNFTTSVNEFSFVDLTTSPQSVGTFAGAGVYVVIVRAPNNDAVTFLLTSGVNSGTGFGYTSGMAANGTVSEGSEGDFTITIVSASPDYFLDISATTGLATLETSSGTATGTTLFRYYQIVGSTA